MSGRKTLKFPHCVWVVKIKLYLLYVNCTIFYFVVWTYLLFFFFFGKNYQNRGDFFWIQNGKSLLQTVHYSVHIWVKTLELVWFTNFEDFGNFYVKLRVITFTVWKCRNFSANQILREINLRDFRSSKAAISAVFEALNFDFGQIFSLQ